MPVSTNRLLREDRARVIRQMQEMTESGRPVNKQKFEALDVEQRLLRDRIEMIEGSQSRGVMGGGQPGSSFDPPPARRAPSERPTPAETRAFGRYLSPRRGRA